MKVVSKHIILFVLVAALIQLLPDSKAISQTNILHRKITIQISEQRLEDALILISKQADFDIAYNAAILSADSLVSITAVNRPVEDILNDVINRDVVYKTRGKHVIIQGKALKKDKSDDKRAKSVIHGYIVNSITGETIANASVYQIDELNSALSNSEGFYSLEVDANTEYVNLAVSKINYRDTIIIIAQAGTENINVSLFPRIPVIESKPVLILTESTNPADNSPLVKIFVPKDARIHAANLGIYERRLAQISFVPMMGSNGLVSGTVINNISLNVIAGYSGGLQGIEAAGVLNVVRSEAIGLQMAGFGNVVGEQTVGIQLAGFFNMNLGKVKGLQAAGFNNLVLDTISGIQMAGFSNVLIGKMNGAQLAGFNNLSIRSVDGVQLAGFANVTTSGVNGFQGAGFANIATGKVNGVQAAGFVNFATQVNSVQLAGFTNIVAGPVNGVQAAGFLNFGTKVKGSQIGFINIADTVSGVTIGFINLVRKGYHELEFSVNEIGQANAAIKLGTPRLYNIFEAGISIEKGTELWNATYGLGTEIRIYKKLISNIEIRSSYLNATNNLSEINQLNSGMFTLGYKFKKNIRINAGPSYNIYISQFRDPDTGNYGYDLGVKPQRSTIVEGIYMAYWPGFKAGIQF